MIVMFLVHSLSDVPMQDVFVSDSKVDKSQLFLFCYVVHRTSHILLILILETILSLVTSHFLHTHSIDGPRIVYLGMSQINPTLHCIIDD